MSWFRMKRGWENNDFFKDEPYSERDAWIWMIGEAQWKDGTVNILGKPTLLKRGQFSDSIRFMAKKFKWSKSKVEHFLERLKKWDMIRTENRTGQLIITVCNYSKYQDRPDAQRDSNGTASGTRTGHEQDKQEEGKEVKKVKKRKRGAVAPAKPESVSLETWNDFLKQRKTKFTQTALNGILKETEKAGWDLERALAHAVMRGWQSFEANWVNKNEGKENGRRTEKYTADDALREVIDEIRADSPPGPPELCDSGHLRQITGGIENADAGDDR